MDPLGLEQVLVSDGAVTGGGPVNLLLIWEAVECLPVIGLLGRHQFLWTLLAYSPCGLLSQIQRIPWFPGNQLYLGFVITNDKYGGPQFQHKKRAQGFYVTSGLK